MRYVALVDGSTGAYGVVVPDLPGCTSAGLTTDEALRNAVEAVRLWVEDAIDDGEALPPPRSVEALRADPEIAAALAAGAVLGMVPLVLDAGRAVRANLSLDAGLLDAIDEAAKAHGLTRSAFLASAARGEDRRAFRITRDACRQVPSAQAACVATPNKRRGNSKSSKMARSKPRVK